MLAISGFVLLSVVAATLADEYNGSWRTSLDSCWTEGLSCNRAMTVSHGGDWNAEFPYDSMAAFENAWYTGADAVKGDFRVTSDNIGMVMHSSPIEIFESLNCYNKKVEEMTAEECMQCQMINKNYNFTSVPNMLAWADGKVNVMYCIKEDNDIARAISTLIENNATHRAFLELKVTSFLQMVEENTIPNWQDVYWVVEIYNSDNIDTLLSYPMEYYSRSFLLEFKNTESWPNDGVNGPDSDILQYDIQRVKEAGLRPMTMSDSNPITATVKNHLEVYHTGFEVVYTYNLGNAVQARVEVNEENGIAPP